MNEPAHDDFDDHVEPSMRLHALPQRWRGRQAFSLLFIERGSAQALMSAVAVWQRDRSRCRVLHLVAIDDGLPKVDTLSTGLALPADARHLSDVAAAVAQVLQAHRRDVTTNLHRIGFDGCLVTLQVVSGDMHHAARALVGEFDAITLGDALHDTTHVAWDRSSFDALARLSRHGATVVGAFAASTVQAGLLRAGFEAMAISSRHWAVKYTPRGPAYDRSARLGPPIAPAHVAIVGAGLAGAHMARTLADRGVRCTVIDRRAEPAREASGGKAGIFHGTVHVGDGVHARLFRAAALHAAAAHRRAIDAGVPGGIDGMLRLSDDALNDLHQVERQAALPAAWARVLDAVQAARLTGCPSGRHGWLFAQGGWIDPRALVRWLLDHPAIALVPNTDVRTLTGDESGWRLSDHRHDMITRADAVVLANAADATRLWPDARWTLHHSLGQSTHVPFDTPGLHAPRVPVSGGGYAIALHDGSVVCGASSHRVDPTFNVDTSAAACRVGDAQDNLDKLNRLTGSRVDTSPTAGMSNHAAWRTLTQDRLPLVGAVPARRLGFVTDNVRHVPRERGLYALTALGSRGLTLAPLMADVVAASMLREPVPLPLALLNAVDAARHATRRERAEQQTLQVANDLATATGTGTPAPP